MNFPAKIAYYEANAGKIVSSENSGGVGWTSEGKMSTNPSDQTGNDVYLYTTKDHYNDDLRNLHSPVTYKARSIVMQYLGDQYSPFTIPNQTVTFQTGTFWLNGQGTDGYPEDFLGGNDMPAIQASNSGSHFIVQSPDGDGSPVKLILPHGLVVKDSNGNTVYKFDTRVQSSYDANNSSTFTFTVPSETDLLSLRNSAVDNAHDTGKLTRVPAGSGGSGGAGGFTITPGTYSGS